MTPSGLGGGSILRPRVCAGRWRRIFYRMASRVPPAGCACAPRRRWMLGALRLAPRDKAAALHGHSYCIAGDALPHLRTPKKLSE